MRCPTCGASLAAKPAEPPFCSPRCKSIDLARWLDGSYRIPAEPVDPDMLPPEPPSPPRRGLS